jgi:hypothetical protein
MKALFKMRKTISYFLSYITATPSYSLLTTAESIRKNGRCHRLNMPLRCLKIIDNTRKHVSNTLENAFGLLRQTFGMMFLAGMATSKIISSCHIQLYFIDLYHLNRNCEYLQKFSLTRHNLADRAYFEAIPFRSFFNGAMDIRTTKWNS